MDGSPFNQTNSHSDTGVAQQAELKPTSERQIRLSIAQAATICSIILGTIGTIAYSIASFLQTKYIVNELNDSNKKVQTDISDLKSKINDLSSTIKLNTLELKNMIEKQKNTSKEVKVTKAEELQ